MINCNDAHALTKEIHISYNIVLFIMYLFFDHLLFIRSKFFLCIYFDSSFLNTF